MDQNQQSAPTTSDQPRPTNPSARPHALTADGGQTGGPAAARAARVDNQPEPGEHISAGLSFNPNSGPGLTVKIEAPQRRATDPGAHYRGPNIFGHALDPYRVLEAYPNITREAARHIVKKILRMGKKGISERQLVAEVRCCLDRWEQMLNEEDQNSPKADES
jgi:hypothetical protein